MTFLFYPSLSSYKGFFYLSWKLFVANVENSTTIELPWSNYLTAPDQRHPCTSSLLFLRTAVLDRSHKNSGSSWIFGRISSEVRSDFPNMVTLLFLTRIHSTLRQLVLRFIILYQQMQQQLCLLNDSFYALNFIFVNFSYFYLLETAIMSGTVIGAFF